MRYRQSAHRRDDNHAAIVDALRACGWVVMDISQAGGGVPDLIAVRNRQFRMIEVKDGSKRPSARALSPMEAKVHASCQQAGVPIVIVENVEQAVRL